MSHDLELWNLNHLDLHIYMPKCAILTLFFEWSPASIYAMCAYFKFILIEVVIPRTTIEKFAPGISHLSFLVQILFGKKKYIYIYLQIASHRSMQCVKIYNYFITWHNVWIILLNVLEILFLKIFFFSPSLQIYHSIILSFFFFSFFLKTLGVFDWYCSIISFWDKR